MKTKWLDRYTVRTPFLCLCLSEAEYFAAIKHLKVEKPELWLDDSFGACVHSFENDGLITCVVCLRPNREPIATAALIVHEATHIKQQLMQSIGEHSPSKEFEAYTMQNICLELFSEYARRLVV